jgi:AraC-like DNA-binding protein
MGVSLKPWVGNVMFETPADEFTDKLVELADLVSDKLILSDNDDDEQHFSCLEQYLFQLLGDRRCDDMSAFLAQHICSSPVRQDVQSVINKIGLSKRRIEQRFLAATGLTIGAFTRKVRFQKAVTLLNNKDGERLTSIALNAGYYDQSHFISEFKYFAAVSPSAFQRQQSDLKDVLVRLTAAG